MRLHPRFLPSAAAASIQRPLDAAPSPPPPPSDAATALSTRLRPHALTKRHWRRRIPPPPHQRGSVFVPSPGDAADASRTAPSTLFQLDDGLKLTKSLVLLGRGRLPRRAQLPAPHLRPRRPARAHLRVDCATAEDSLRALVAALRHAPATAASSYLWDTSPPWHTQRNAVDEEMRKVDAAASKISVVLFQYFHKAICAELVVLHDTAMCLAMETSGDVVVLATASISTSTTMTPRTRIKLLCDGHHFISARTS